MLSKEQAPTTGKDSSPWSMSSWFEEEYQHPASLAVIWAPDVLTVAGKPPTRGFGGRIYFYNEKSQAIPVDGDLVVHAYLTTDRIGVDNKAEADKTYGFTGDTLSTHFSPSELGASYSIWIPWDKADGFQEELTLIPTFKSKEGAVVQGAPAKVYLPGKNRSEPETPVRSQMISYRKTSTPTNVPQESAGSSALSTTTIAIPQDSNISRKKSGVSRGGESRTREILRQALEEQRQIQSQRQPVTPVAPASHQTPVGASAGGQTPEMLLQQQIKQFDLKSAVPALPATVAPTRPAFKESSFKPVPWTERRNPANRNAA